MILPISLHSNNSNSMFPVFSFIKKKSPVGRNGRIRIGVSIFQVNDISFDEGIDKRDIVKVLEDALKLQCVRLVVGQKEARVIVSGLQTL